MSKKDVEREAKRLAQYLDGRQERGDRVIVMVVRNNIEEMSVDIGVETVQRGGKEDPISDEMFAAASNSKGRIVRVRTVRKAPKRAKKKA